MIRLRRRDLVCQQAVELVTDYLEGALSRADRRRYEGHLAGCPHCTEYLAQMRKTIELTGTLTPDDLTPQMQDEFIAVYRQWRAGPPEDAVPEDAVPEDGPPQDAVPEDGPPQP